MALPMMLLLLIGAVEVSRAISVNNTLVQFTREAGNLNLSGNRSEQVSGDGYCRHGADSARQ